MMRARPITFAAALAGCIAAACTDGTGTGGPTTQLKVVHAAAALGAVDVQVGNRAVITGLPYGQSSALTDVPGGAQHITVRSGSVVIAQLDAMLTMAGVNAITVGDDTVQVTPVTPDTGIAISNRANVRMINIVGTNTSEPTNLDVLLNFPDVSPDSVAVFGLNTTIASHGPLMYFNPGHFRVRFVPDGGSAVLTEAEFDVAAGQKKAIVLSRSDAGVYSVRIVTEP